MQTRNLCDGTCVPPRHFVKAGGRHSARISRERPIVRWASLPAPEPYRLFSYCFFLTVHDFPHKISYENAFATVLN